MKINYIKYLRRERPLDLNFLPDMPDEQAENVYCNLIVQFIRLLHYHYNFTLLSITSIVGIAVFALIFAAVKDITQLQIILVSAGLILCCLSWIYFSVAIYILVCRQPIIEKSLRLMELEYPDVAKHFTNEIIFHYNYNGRDPLSYLRAMLLSVIASPIYCLLFLSLKRLGIIYIENSLSDVLIFTCVLLVFISLNFLYVKYCKSKNK